MILFIIMIKVTKKKKILIILSDIDTNHVNNNNNVYFILMTITHSNIATTQLISLECHNIYLHFPQLLLFFVIIPLSYYYSHSYMIF